jgi:hypothetical protein
MSAGGPVAAVTVVGQRAYSKPSSQLAMAASSRAIRPSTFHSISQVSVA